MTSDSEPNKFIVYEFKDCELFLEPYRLNGTASLFLQDIGIIPTKRQITSEFSFKEIQKNSWLDAIIKLLGKEYKLPIDDKTGEKIKQNIRDFISGVNTPEVRPPESPIEPLIEQEPNEKTSLLVKDLEIQSSELSKSQSSIGNEAQLNGRGLDLSPDEAETNSPLVKDSIEISKGEDLFSSDLDLVGIKEQISSLIRDLIIIIIREEDASSSSLKNREIDAVITVLKSSLKRCTPANVSLLKYISRTCAFTSTMAAKSIGCSERWINKLLPSLMNDGILKVIKRQAGRGKPIHIYVVPGRAEWADVDRAEIEHLKLTQTPEEMYLKKAVPDPASILKKEIKPKRKTKAFECIRCPVPRPFHREKKPDKCPYCDAPEDFIQEREVHDIE